MSDTYSSRYGRNGEDQNETGDTPDFSSYIARERQRLQAERDNLRSQQEDLQRELDAINREFQAIEAYESHKTGRSVGSRSVSGQARRVRRGSRRQELLDLVKNSNGLSRGEILDKLGLKGDKSAEMSVSNALTALTKSNEFIRQGGKYVAA